METVEKSIKCNQCDYESSVASHLRRHLTTHSGEKLNKCDQCDYVSSRADSLRTHLKIHNGEKSNKCNQCDFASSLAGNLRRHLKMHNGEKWNKCNQLNYITFYVTMSLLRQAIWGDQKSTQQHWGNMTKVKWWKPFKYKYIYSDLNSKPISIFYVLHPRFKCTKFSIVPVKTIIFFFRHIHQKCNVRKLKVANLSWENAIIMCLSTHIQKLGQRVSQNEVCKCPKKRVMADVLTTGRYWASEVSGVEPSLSLATSSAIAHWAWPSFRPQSIIALDSITLIIISLFLIILIPIILVVIILIILILMTLILILIIPILIILTLIIQSTEHQPANNHHPHPCCYNHPSKRWSHSSSLRW